MNAPGKKRVPYSATAPLFRKANPGSPAFLQANRIGPWPELGQSWAWVGRAVVKNRNYWNIIDTDSLR
jgi:hypothetical protein